MSGGRSIWLSQDATRHRRALMVELKHDHGPVAIACDTVLCAHAKLQNDGGAIRDGFAAVAEEAGCTRDEARAFITDAATIGWLDDLEIDDDGRRFRCRVSGWSADQDKAYAAWRKRDQRAAAKGDTSPSGTTNGDRVGSVPECPPTEQDRTVEPPLPPDGGRTRDQRAYEVDLAKWTERNLPGANPKRVHLVASFLRGRISPLTADALTEFAASDPKWALFDEEDIAHAA